MNLKRVKCVKENAKKKTLNMYIALTVSKLLREMKNLKNYLLVSDSLSQKFI